MSDWLEYCNQTKGEYAALRAANGHKEPYGVKYWSIGNENYGSWEIGSKSASEWSRYVTESAKMMKRVDPSAELFAASVAGLDWNVQLLREAGKLLDWVSIHGYWDGLVEENNPSDYETCMIYSTKVEEPIEKVKNILGALGFDGKIKVAYDEWNLRSWHHPGIMDFDILDPDHEHAAMMRDGNDINSIYTMADAVFSAIFLSSCLRNCDTIQMANFSPIVNTRGAIYTHHDGIVLRPTYHVFELYTNHMGETVVDSYIRGDNSYSCKGSKIENVDVVATLTDEGKLALACINRNPEEKVCLQLTIRDDLRNGGAIYTLNGDSKDSFNDIDCPDAVTIQHKRLEKEDPIILDEHSVNVICFD